ncbi:MAG: DNA-formamidopyrimidine glycosylase [Patescibacteria group bacterium]|nr:DNA-formamidopyrimidine glycosylase [Patescibacteria group bacterium]
MPELPEVETTVLDLRKKVLKRTFVDIWTDFKKMIKRPKSFQKFRKELIGKKVENVRRRAKNILIDISNDKTLLLHQKISGHTLVGRWELKKKQWVSKLPGPLLDDSKNRFLHLIFFLDNGKQLAISDPRKFAKAELWDRDELEKEFKNLGPEPLEDSFTFEEFKKSLKKRKKGKIKQVLMDQRIIAGIGNIYSDEILWDTRISPFKDINSLNDQELKNIYTSIKKILKKGIQLKGDSISDYRKIDGTKGGFQLWGKAYGREGKKCQRCRTIIKREKIGGRSAHFCPKCQS